MPDIWLPGVVQVRITGKGNGPFGSGLPLGWVLHVNQSNGNLDAFFRSDPPANPASVCPNFQVYKDGTIHQHLPLNWSPWCQADGNAHYGAVETEGYDYEPLTPAQVAALGWLHRQYRDQLRVPDAIATLPGERGIGAHYMGGPAWGGHTCPGPIRASQRQAIIDASHPVPTPAPAPAPPPTTSEGDTMELLTAEDVAQRTTVLIVGATPVLIHDGAQVTELESQGVPHRRVPGVLFDAIVARLGGTGAS